MNRFFVLESSGRELLSRNAFGILRLILAVTVLFQHALVLSSNGQLVYFGYFKEADLGSTGVGGFFAISGFLLAGSAQRLSSREFLIHRIFRLLPGLWFALIVSAFLLVPVASLFGSTQSAFDYFGKDSSLTYVLLNMGLFVFQNHIGNVFGSNPYPLAVNGSLWTLAPEFICYTGLIVMAIVTRRKVRAQKTALSISVIVSSVISLASENSTNPFLSGIVHPASGLGIAFATGALLAVIFAARPYRPSPQLTVSLLIAWLFLGLNGPLSMISLSVIVVSLGLSLTNSKVSNIGRKADVSYGVYLFHFPVLQAIMLCSTSSWSPLASLTLLPILTLFVVVPLAWISWRFIESPAIKFARTYARK